MTRTALALAFFVFVAAATATPQPISEQQVIKRDFAKGSGKWSDFVQKMKASPRFAADPLLAGGVSVINGEFPSTVFILNDEGWYCMGTLIDSKHVVSTLGCTEVMFGTTVLVAAGEVNIGSETSPSMQVKVAVTGYTLVNSVPASRNKDIVVMEMDSKFSTNSNVKVATVATSELAVGSSATATSWGEPPAVGSYWPLQRLGMTIASDADLGAGDYYDIFGAKSAVGTGICVGDAGTPLYNSNKQLLGVAIFSTGTSCTSGRPAGFTSAVYYRDWITCMSGGKCKNAAGSVTVSAVLVMAAVAVVSLFIH